MPQSNQSKRITFVVYTTGEVEHREPVTTGFIRNVGSWFIQYADAFVASPPENETEEKWRAAEQEFADEQIEE